MGVIAKIGFGGGCHWCTEAVFQSLKGVVKVDQGFIAQKEDNSSFSEAVIITYNADQIGLKILIEIHLHTHKSTSIHSMRTKYRSAIYVFEETTFLLAQEFVYEFQTVFNQSLITQVYHFKSFKYSKEQFHNYYYSNPKKPFCQTYIAPKLKLLLIKFSRHVNTRKVSGHHELT